jgi:outer membrane lipoprotein-sorting protein
MQQGVRLLMLVCSLITMRSGAQEQDDATARQLLMQVRGSSAPIADVGYHAEITLTFATHPPVSFLIEGVVKVPDKAKVTIIRRLAPQYQLDPIMDSVGLTLVLNGPRFLIYNPFDGQIIEADLTQPIDFPLPTAFQGSGWTPNIGAYVRDIQTMMSVPDMECHLDRQETVGGATVQVVEVKFPKALRLFEPHEVTSVRLWIDEVKSVPIKSEAYDASGKVVAETTYQDFQEIEKGVWAALSCTTRIAGGSLKAVKDMMVKRDNEKEAHPEQWSTEIPVKERTIRRHFEWVENKVLLPRSMEVIDASGQALAQMYFYAYVINRGIDDAQFEVPGN